MCAKNFIAVCLILMPLANTAHADVIPGRWEIIERLESGTPITIKLKEGDRMECSLKAVDAKALEVVDSTGQVIAVPKSAVDQILGIEKEKDSNLNGTLWGLAIGGAGGTVIGAATSSRASNEGASAAAWTAGLGLVGAGIGALTGYLGDSAQRSSPVLYRSSRE